MAASTRPEIKAFFDEPTNTVSYLVWDPATKEAASSTRCSISTTVAATRRSNPPIERCLPSATRHGVTIKSNSRDACACRPPVGRALYEAERPALRLPSANISRMCSESSGRSSTPPIVSGEAPNSIICSRTASASRSAAIDAEVIYTPGHTPACVSYKIGDAVFVGDTMFMPDYGTARADFPGGDARNLYRSIRAHSVIAERDAAVHVSRLQGARPRSICLGDDGGRGKGENVHVHEGVSEDEFVKMREARDATLATPLLLLPSIQVNIRAGKFPPAEANGVHYLKVPVKIGALMLGQVQLFTLT